MTKQEIARELEALGVTLTASQIKKAKLEDLEVRIAGIAIPGRLSAVVGRLVERALREGHFLRCHSGLHAIDYAIAWHATTGLINRSI